MHDLSVYLTRAIAVAGILLLIAMLLAALANMRTGSLDDLPADLIEKAVNDGA